MKLSIVIPCLNEELTIGSCIEQAKKGLLSLNIDSEIVVVDNGSTDRSLSIIKEKGARIISVPVRGYGNALIAGIIGAKGEYVVMGDSDGTYDFTEAVNFMQKFNEGCEIVLGNRFKGKIEKGAMPFQNRYLGNPAISFLIRLLYGKGFGDTQCGLRGGKRETLLKLRLVCTGMEFASEMAIKALESGVKIGEVPIHLHPDVPGRKPHLRPWRDGFRHLKYIIGHKLGYRT